MQVLAVMPIEFRIDCMYNEIVYWQNGFMLILLDGETMTRLDDLAMAKKRDHKILISDDAIEKVPRIEYKEIPESHYDILQKLAKETLKISKERNNSNEVAITYSLNGIEDLINGADEYIGIALGGEHDVDPEEDAVSYHILNTAGECVVVVLHNHPSLSKHSLSDIQFLLRYYTLKMLVVVTNLGSISYVVKTKNYNRQKAIKLYNEAVTYHEQAGNLKGYQKSTEYFLNNCYKCGLIYENR